MAHGVHRTEGVSVRLEPAARDAAVARLLSRAAGRLDRRAPGPRRARAAPPGRAAGDPPVRDRTEAQGLPRGRGRGAGRRRRSAAAQATAQTRLDALRAEVGGAAAG